MTQIIPAIAAEATFADGLKFRPQGQHRLSAREIIAEVAERHNLTPADLSGERRTRLIAAARQEAMYELRQRTRLSTPQIGRYLGGRDHTTVLYGILAHQRRIGA